MAVKRALVCAPLMPEYDREGGSRRTYHLIEFLRREGWAVSFIAREGTHGERYARMLRQMGVATYAGAETFYTGDDYLPDPEELLRHGKFDLALLSFWAVAEHFLPMIRAFSPETRVIVDSIDLHFLRDARRTFHRQSTRPGPTMLDATYGEEMVREINTYAAADIVLAVSRKEAELIGDLLADPGKVLTVPLMEDLAFSTVPFDIRTGILFVGNFRHPPNVEAVEYLCHSILPHIDPALLAEHPIAIVGNQPDETVERLAREHAAIRLVGWVPSLEPYFRRARVSVIPLLHGAGTKTKLIQSLMLGTPSVSTSIGIEGLELRDGDHVVVADDPGHFAAGITTLLTDADTWQRLASQGRVHIAATHGREAVRERFLAAVEATLNR